MKFTASAPGRVCLFGEHQDYLGLSVIPAAINRRARVQIETTTDSGIITFQLPDLGKKGTIHLPDEGKLLLKQDELDYFRAVLNVFIEKGHWDPDLGLAVRVQSEVPILSGLSSSAAILVAWTKGLDHLLGTALTPIEVGYYAYLAEHNEMGIPCGQMDQLAASVGGVFHMVCTEPPQVEPIEVVGLEGLVVGNTLIPKSTNQVHGVRVAELKGAMEYLKSRMDFDIHTTHFAEVEGLLAAENPIWLKRMRAALMDRDLAQVALGELRQQPVNAVRVGQLLLEHQAYLRDDFEVSVQRIEDMIGAGMTAGALGGKLVGAGMGGSIVMLAPGKQTEVAKALTAAGGEGFPVEIDVGARIDEN